MRLMVITAVLLGQLLAFSLSGCAVWPGGGPGKAVIYVYREAGGVEGPYPKAVFLDGRQIGQLMAEGYLVVSVSPGTHVISTPAANQASVTLIAEKGKTYYVSQEIIPTPPVYHVLLNRVAEPMGKQRVSHERRLPTE